MTYVATRRGTDAAGRCTASPNVPCKGADCGLAIRACSCFDGSGICFWLAIRKLARENKAVIVISSYLPEILAISDRILVARGGRIVEEMARADATSDKIMYAAIH